MKRKLICIFFMLAGAAILVGTILLSLRRPEDADASPVFTLIIFAIVTIAMAVWYMNREPYEPKIFGREKVILWAFRAVNILSALICLAFIVILWFLTRQYTNWMHNVFSLMVLAAAGIAAAALGLRERSPIFERHITKSAFALMIAVVLVFTYLSYMPKYSLVDGINMLRSKHENAQKDIYDFDVGLADSYIVRRADDLISFGPNPFFALMYQFGCDSYSYDAGGLHIKKGYISFNPANGAYEYLRKPGHDMVFFPGECPAFNWSFLNDRDGQHGAVLNLYFRKLYAFDAYQYTVNPMLTVSSDEWDAKLKDVMYPYNFPEDEARDFLKSIGEEALKTKLLKQLNDLDQVVVFDKKEDGTIGPVIIDTKDKTVEIFFFGINIATYQNKEIVLKR